MWGREMLEVFIMERYCGSKICGNIFDVYGMHVGYKFCETHRKKISVVMKKCLCRWSLLWENSVHNMWIYKIHKLRPVTQASATAVSPALASQMTLSGRREGRFQKEAHQSEKACSRLPSVLSLAQIRLQTHFSINPFDQINSCADFQRLLPSSMPRGWGCPDDHCPSGPSPSSGAQAPRAAQQQGRYQTYGKTQCLQRAALQLPKLSSQWQP